MPRSLRVAVAGDIRHITQHGVGEMPIYRDDNDRSDFLRLLGIELVRSSWTCLSYCLMKTHYHVVVRLRKDLLSSGFQHLNATYALRYNKLYGRRGHVFEARFRDRLVDSEQYLAEVMRYVHLNPTRALGGLPPEEYQWSDYGSTVGRFPADPLVDAATALEPFGNNLAEARRNYAAFVEERDVRIRRGQTRVRPWFGS